jgi:hypothetical protein
LETILKFIYGIYETPCLGKQGELDQLDEENEKEEQDDDEEPNTTESRSKSASLGHITHLPGQTRGVSLPFRSNILLFSLLGEKFREKVSFG